MNDKQYFCGTETAESFGVYMESAIVAAVRVAGNLGTKF
jgi:monoamine oxidase